MSAGIELELLLAGWRTMADHLVVCDLETGRVLPYLTPLGVRGEGLRTWADALARAEVMETVSEVTGRVVLVDAESLVPGSSWDTPLAPKGVVFLRDSSEQADSFTVRIFPASHRQAVMRMLPDQMVSVDSADTIRALWENAGSPA